MPPGGEAVLLDFFVETPGRGHDPADHAPLRAVTVDFGDATQVFHVGAASCGTYGTPAGLAAAVAEFGRAPLSELAAPAVRLARAGVRVTVLEKHDDFLRDFRGDTIHPSTLDLLHDLGLGDRLAAVEAGQRMAD